MTRKQFFKEVGLDQPKDKQPFVDLIKRYKGKLSYTQMYMLVLTAVMLGKCGQEIFSYIEVIIENER